MTPAASVVVDPVRLQDEAGPGRHATVRIAGGVWVGILLGTVILDPPLASRFELIMPVALIAAVVAVPYAVGIVAGRARHLGWIWLALAGAGAVLLRIALQGADLSDVLRVTVAAIERWSSGASPYGVGFMASDPPGAPFPYGPIALIWYAPAGPKPAVIELAVSIAIAMLLVIRARPVGAAVYAFCPLIALAAVDGSNDTSVSLLVLLGLLSLAWRGLVGGAVLGLAAAFKLFAAAWFLPAVAAFGLPVALGFGLAFVGVWAPAIVAWGPWPIIDSLRRAVEIHPRPAFSLAALIEMTTSTRVERISIETVRLLGSAAVAAVASLLVWTRRIDVALAGLILLIVADILGYRGTMDYLVIGAPVLCWELDRWLGTTAWAPRWPIPRVDDLADRLRRLGPAESRPARSTPRPT